MQQGVLCNFNDKALNACKQHKTSFNPTGPDTWFNRNENQRKKQSSLAGEQAQKSPASKYTDEIKLPKKKKKTHKSK